jgi:alkylation response protein AidB-like acyl-CoA dehydrogenase
VNVELTEEQELFRSTTRKLLENTSPLTTVRAAYELRSGFDGDWWRQAAELGWTSFFISETLGGGCVSGRPTVDAVIVAEEMGRLVAPGPFLPVNVVAAALAWRGSEDQQREVCPDLLAGDAVATWAFCEPGGQWNGSSIHATATVGGASDILLEGTKAYVEAGGVAQHLLVTARTHDRLTQLLVPSDAPGVEIVRGRSIDMTRRFARVRFEEVRLPSSAVVGEIGGADADVDRQLQLALALQCAEMVGVADRALEFTLEYGRDRFAFGRPIVSFQALKHRIADMTVWLEGAKAVSDALAAAVDLRDDQTDHLASVAKAYVGDHCLAIVDDCVQLAGGIGVTWEHDIHLYNRRVAVDRAIYGTPEEHKLQLLSLLESK